MTVVCAAETRVDQNDVVRIVIWDDGPDSLETNGKRHWRTFVQIIISEHDTQRRWFLIACKFYDILYGLYGEI